MKDIVYTINEAEEALPGEYWESQKHYCLNSFKDEQMYHFDRIDEILASIFAYKDLDVNETALKHKPMYRVYPVNIKTGNDTLHNAYLALLDRVEWYFKQKLNLKIKSKNLRYKAQFSSIGNYILVADKITNKALVFLSI